MCWTLVHGQRFGCGHFLATHTISIIQQCDRPNCITGWRHQPDCPDCPELCALYWEVGRRVDTEQCAGFCASCRYIRMLRHRD